MLAQTLTLLALVAFGTVGCGCTTSCVAIETAPLVDARLHLALPADAKLEGAAITVLLDNVLYDHQATLVTSPDDDVVRCEKTPNTTWKWECAATQSKRVMEVELRLPQAPKVAIEIAIMPVGGPRTVIYKAAGTSSTRDTKNECGDGAEYTWTLKETLTSS